MKKTLEQNTVSELGRKLDEFSDVLTPEERAVLLGLLGAAGSSLESAAAQSETEGGVSFRTPPEISVPQRLPRFSDALNTTFNKFDIGGGTDPLQDSVGVGVFSVSWSKDYNMTAPGMDRTNPINTIPGFNFRR